MLLIEKSYLQSKFSANYFNFLRIQIDKSVQKYIQGAMIIIIIKFQQV